MESRKINTVLSQDAADALGRLAKRHGNNKTAALNAIILQADKENHVMKIKFCGQCRFQVGQPACCGNKHAETVEKTIQEGTVIWESPVNSNGFHQWNSATVTGFDGDNITVVTQGGYNGKIDKQWLELAEAGGIAIVGSRLD